MAWSRQTDLAKHLHEVTLRQGIRLLSGWGLQAMQATSAQTTGPPGHTPFRCPPFPLSSLAALCCGGVPGCELPWHLRPCHAIPPLGGGKKWKSEEEEGIGDPGYYCSWSHGESSSWVGAQGLHMSSSHSPSGHQVGSPHIKHQDERKKATEFRLAPYIFEQPFLHIILWL